MRLQLLSGRFADHGARERNSVVCIWFLPPTAVGGVGNRVLVGSGGGCCFGYVGGCEHIAVVVAALLAVVPHGVPIPSEPKHH